MGTTGSLRIIKGDKIIWFYEDSDGYPRILGIAILEMLKNMIAKYGIEGLQKKFDEVKIRERDMDLTEEEQNKIRTYCKENNTDISWWPGLNNVYDMETIIGAGFAEKSGGRWECCEYMIDLDNLTVKYLRPKHDTSYSFTELDTAIEEWKDKW